MTAPGRRTDLYGPTYAALDLGTNNCRLLVARPTRDGFRVVDAFSRIIRLGEGITALRPPQRRGDRARGRGARDLPRQDAQPRRHARAADRDRGLPLGGQRRRIPRPRRANEVGLELEIVDRETEARLAATGCTPLIDPDADGVILFDIGGGSSELVRLGRSARCRPRAAAAGDRGWASLPVGVVTLAERHGGIDGDARGLRGDGRGGRRASLRRSPPRNDGTTAPHASARHLRHRHDHRRRASRAQALRPPPRRRLLDERRRGRPAWSSGCSP